MKIFKKLVERESQMLAKKTKQKQVHFLYPDIMAQLEPKMPLLILAEHIPWDTLEEEFALLYVFWKAS